MVIDVWGARGQIVGEIIFVLGAIAIGWCIFRNLNRRRLEKKKHKTNSTQIG